MSRKLRNFLYSRFLYVWIYPMNAAIFTTCEKRVDDTILELGVFHEQIARFWKPRGEDAWHGHPLWPVVTDMANNRMRQEYRPDRSVFRKLVDQRVLSPTESDRLNSGKII